MRFLPAPCLDRYLSFSSCLAFAASGESVKGCNSKKKVCARVRVASSCVRVCGRVGACACAPFCFCACVRVCVFARVRVASSPCRLRVVSRAVFAVCSLHAFCLSARAGITWVAWVFAAVGRSVGRRSSAAATSTSVVHGPLRADRHGRGIGGRRWHPHRWQGPHEVHHHQKRRWHTHLHKSWLPELEDD